MKKRNTLKTKKLKTRKSLVKRRIINSKLFSVVSRKAYF